MATTLQQVESGLFGGIIVAANADATGIESWIAANEAKIPGLLTDLFKAIPSVNGIAGVVEGPILNAVETGISTYVNQFLAQATPAEVFALFIAMLTKFQSEV